MTVNERKVRGGLPDGFPPPTSEGGRLVMGPAAGNGNGSDLNNAGSNGNYWSSTPNSDNSNNAWNLNCNSSNFKSGNNYRHNGYPVRPVKDPPPTVRFSASCVVPDLVTRIIRFVSEPSVQRAYRLPFSTANRNSCSSMISS